MPLKVMTKGVSSPLKSKHGSGRDKWEKSEKLKERENLKMFGSGSVCIDYSYDKVSHTSLLIDYNGESKYDLGEMRCLPAQH